jgi:hypothetical protein
MWDQTIHAIELTNMRLKEYEKWTFASIVMAQMPLDNSGTVPGIRRSMFRVELANPPEVQWISSSEECCRGYCILALDRKWDRSNLSGCSAYSFIDCSILRLA